MAQTPTPRLPDTPVSPRRDQWSPSRSSGRPASRASPNLSPQRPSSNRSGKAPVLADQPDIRLQETPASPISISPPRQGIQAPERASIRGFPGMGARRATQEEAEQRYATPDSEHMYDSVGSLPIRSLTPSGAVKMVREEQNHSRASSSSGKAPRIEEFGPPLPPEQAGEEEAAGQQSPGLVYSAFDDAPQKKRQQQRSDKHAQNRASQMTVLSTGSGSSSGAGSSGDHRASQLLAPQPVGISSRPLSTSTLGEIRGRTLSPLSYNGSDPASSPRPYARDLSGSSRRSPSTRPLSYIDLLSNVPYSQQVAPGPSSISNAPLQTAVGAGASLLDTKKTLEMYRANVKKTNDASVQYEFAIFMINTAREIMATDPAAGGSPNNSGSKSSGSLNPTELIQEAKHILQRLSDRAYPFAQYYLADGYSSGFFNPNSKPDHDKAFPLFVSASKHGHAEAGYRAALSYEFAWGTSKNYAKAVQFLRASASKGHPGAATRLALACLRGDMGLPKTKDSYREGCRWLRRAAENADFT
ncbi:HCP-like protein, partial [Hortaea werneckii]